MVTATDIGTPLIVVSGLSGSGKTVVLRTLEDLDYYCVDNLPAELLPDFVRSVLVRGVGDAEDHALGTARWRAARSAA